MASLAISHSAASQRHMVGTEQLSLPFRQGRALVKNSGFCWMPLNVCQHSYFILCHFSFRRLDAIFVSWCTFLRPLGGDTGSEGGGQRRGSELPPPSSRRHQWGPAQQRNHPLLFESNHLNCIWLFCLFFNVGQVPLSITCDLWIFAGGQNPHRCWWRIMQTGYWWVQVAVTCCHRTCRP